MVLIGNIVYIEKIKAFNIIIICTTILLHCEVAEKCWFLAFLKPLIQMNNRINLSLKNSCCDNYKRLLIKYNYDTSFITTWKILYYIQTNLKNSFPVKKNTNQN